MAFPLTAYIEAALEVARYDKLEDGSAEAFKRVQNLPFLKS